jgi:hypothetical protein
MSGVFPAANRGAAARRGLPVFSLVSVHGS